MKLANSKKFMFSTILFAFAALSAVIMSVLYSLTSPKIEAQKAEAYKTFMQDAYKTTSGTAKTIGYEYSKGKVDMSFDMGSKGTAYVVTGNGGRNGDIQLFISLRADESLISVNFINSGETKGFWEKVEDAINAQAKLVNTSYTYFAATSAENGFGITSGSSLTSGAVQNAFRSLYFCKEEGACK